MLILMGRTASGKTLVRDKLVKNHGFNSVVTYTTRPMRKDEIPDVTYHYISEEDFLQKIESSFFAEWKKYTTADGIWYYGSAKEDYEKADENSVIILTPDGIRDIQKLGYDVTVIYLYSNISTINKRLDARGDKKEETERRIKTDISDFKDAESLANRIVYNNFDENIDDVVNSVLFHYRKAYK